MSKVYWGMMNLDDMDYFNDIVLPFLFHECRQLMLRKWTTITVRPIEPGRIDVQVDVSLPAVALWTAIEAKVGHPLGNINLIFQGKALSLNVPLLESGVREMSLVVVVFVP